MTETLQEHINRVYSGSQASFARANNIKSPQQITQWLNKDFIIVDYSLYSHRRGVKNPDIGNENVK